jgi:hypothetical protein
VSLPRWASTAVTICAGVLLFAVGAGLVLMAAAISGDASWSEVLRVGGGTVLLLIWFLQLALYSPWWRSRLDHLLTPRPARR